MNFELISDLFKDARGFRPSADWMKDFDNLSDEGKSAVYESLLDEMKENEMAEAALNDKAVEEFEARIDKMMSDFNIDWPTAIRWDLEANGITKDMLERDMGVLADQEIVFYLWEQGITKSADLAKIKAKIKKSFGFTESNFEMAFCGGPL